MTTDALTPKQRFIKALRREPLTGHVPHFELVFFLTAEAIGRVQPVHRVFTQWNQMSRSEQQWHIRDVADVYLEVARKYDHSCILVQSPFDDDATRELLYVLRDRGGDQYCLMMHGDPTYAIPDGDSMIEFSAMLYEEPDKMKAQSARTVEHFSRLARGLADDRLADGFILCSDYCFNTNPFFGPALFEEFIAPYLKEILDTYRSLGLYSIKHTDGNIMPILDQMVACGPDALHSLDPQGGVSLAEVKRLYGDRVALCGNVNCGLLQTGTQEECEADIRRALRDGMAGGPGYIFCTSNCVYTGLALERYELMHRIWREEGIYA